MRLCGIKSDEVQRRSERNHDHGKQSEVKQDREQRVASPDDVVADAVELPHKQKCGQRHADRQQHGGDVADRRSAG